MDRHFQATAGAGPGPTISDIKAEPSDEYLRDSPSEPCPCPCRNEIEALKQLVHEQSLRIEKLEKEAAEEQLVRKQLQVEVLRNSVAVAGRVGDNSGGGGVVPGNSPGNGNNAGRKKGGENREKDRRPVSKPVPAKEATTKKPRGGRMSGYTHFLQKRRHVEPVSATINFTEFSQNCANKWKVMSEEDKRPFQQMAEEDKNGYELEMEVNLPDHGGDGGDGNIGGEDKLEVTKRPHYTVREAPKRPLSPFYCFCNDKRIELRERYPGWSISETAKALTNMWSLADPDTKRKYKAIADEDKERYEREMVAFKKSRSSE